MQIRISKGNDVPIREQLVEQIIFLIATGQMKPGEALPAVRALGRRLKIHHNTVSKAYQELVERQWLSRRRGRRLVVRTLEEASTQSGMEQLDDLINATIHAARDRGYTLGELRQRVQERLMAQPADHFLVVDEEPGMRHLLREELRQEFCLPVEMCSVTELSSKPEVCTGAVVVTPPGLVREVTDAIPKDRTVVPIVFSEADEYVEQVLRMNEPSVIAVVSISERFLAAARGLLSSVVGKRHTIREYLVPSETPRALNAAAIVFCDSITKGHVKTPNSVHYRLISSNCLKQLANAVND